MASEVLQGPAGRAARVEVPDVPAASETLAIWLIDAPGQSPAWSQYVLFVVRLRDDQPGFAPPLHHFDGTTHELDVWALDPAQPVTVESMEAAIRDGVSNLGARLLTPVNVCTQFIATDDEMLELVGLAVQGVVDGLLPAEPPLSGNPRGVWLQPLTKTLAHIRGEEHAP